MADSSGVGSPILLLVGGYEEQLGVPKGFAVKLLNEPDDWSFVIKLHALLEGALTKKLLALIDKPGVTKPFQKIGMRSKVEFAKALTAVSSRSATFLEELGVLRNTLVHDIANIKFRLSEWASRETKSARLMGPDVAEGLKAAGAFEPYRFVLWGQMVIVLAELQEATVAEATRVQQLIDAEVEKRARLQDEAVHNALLELMAGEETSEQSDGHA